MRLRPPARHEKAWLPSSGAKLVDQFLVRSIQPARNLEISACAFETCVLHILGQALSSCDSRWDDSLGAAGSILVNVGMPASG